MHKKTTNPRGIEFEETIFINPVKQFKNMGQLTQISFMRDLSNDQFVALYEQILGVLNDVEHNITSEIYEKALENVTRHYQEAAQIKAKDQVHYLTAPINALHKKRSRSFRSVNHEIKARLYHPDIMVQEDADHFEKWYRKHAKSLVSGSKDVTTRRIDSIANDLEEDEVTLDLFKKLELMPLFNLVLEMNNEFKDMVSIRAKDRARKKTKYVDSPQIRNNIMDDLLLLLREIEREIDWNPGVDVAKHLKLALVDVIVRAKTTYKQKKARNQNQQTNAEDANNTNEAPAAYNGLEADGGNNKEQPEGASSQTTETKKGGDTETA